MENNKKLDGVWKNNAFKIKIKGDTYVSFYKNFRYGKGKIIYDNENFVLTLTHARGLIFWTPFVEVVGGKYIYENDRLTVSGIEGRYNDYNGIWTCYGK